MAFHLSTVVAYMCGVEVSELQLPFSTPTFPIRESVDAADTAVVGPAAPDGEGKKRNCTTDGRGSTATLTATTTTTTATATATRAATTNKPSTSADWMWRARREFAASVLSKKERIVAPSPPVQKRANPTHSGASSNTDSLSTPNASRLEATPMTEMVAQTLPFLGCPPVASTLFASSASEEVRWGVPRWPACIITVGGDETDAEEGKDDGDGNGGGSGFAVPTSPPHTAVLFESSVVGRVSLRWPPDDATSTPTAVSQSPALSSDAEARGRAAPRVVVRVCAGRGRSGLTASLASSVLDSRGVATFCDPAPSTATPLPSRVQCPSSLLLPDAVYLRNIPPPRLSTPSTTSLLRARSTPSAVAVSGSDGPAVELLLIAVEGLPELYETRRQGLMLYKELLLRQYALKRADVLARREGEAGDVPTSAGPPELPSLRWRCELWTPLPEGRAAGLASAPNVTGASLSDVCRTVVQTGVYSTYTPNKSAVTPPSTSLAACTPSDILTAAAATAAADTALAACPPHSTPLGRHLLDRDDAASKRARARSPLLPLPFGDLEVHLRTFCAWWTDMEALAQPLLSPALPSPPVTDIFSAAQGSSASVAPRVSSPEDAARVRGAVEQLLLWWAARSVRSTSTRAPRLTPQLPPLSSGAAPLFGAIVIPAHARISALAPAAAASTSAVGGGALSPPAAVSLPSLTLCFVNPKGAFVHQYDLEALNVLCRAVHALRASVFVFDAAQKAALVEWVKCFVLPFAPSATTSPSSSTAGRTPPVSPAGSSTAGAATSPVTAAPTTDPYLQYPYDACAEIEQRCFCLEDYVYDRHRRILADGEEEEEEESESEREKEKGGFPQSTQVSPPSSLLGGVLHKARTGAAPSLKWCRDARVLACADLLGRRRLDIFTSLLKRTPQTTSSPTQLAGTFEPVSASRPSPPPVQLNPLPSSFLSYTLTRIGDNGVEEVEQLSGTILQMARRLSGG